MKARRRLAVQRVREGWTQKAVAAFLGVGERAVGLWVGAHRRAGDGGLRAKPHAGRTPYLTPAQERLLISRAWPRRALCSRRAWRAVAVVFHTSDSSRPPLTPHDTMSDPAPAAAAPKRKPRRIYRLLRIGIPLLVVLILLAPWVVSKTGLRDRLINHLIRSPDVTATSQSGSFGWFSPLSAQGMELTSEKRHVRIQVNEIAAERAWWRLAGSSSELGTITLEKPHIHIELPLGPRVERPKRQIPTFTGVVRNGGLTVRVPDLDEPVIDLDDIDLTFRVVEADGGRVLVVDPVTIFQHRKLSPKLCDKMLHLIAPTLGDTQEVSGEVSFALDRFRVPLGLPKDQVAWQVEMEGTLTLHNVTTQTTGPLLLSVVKVVSDMYGKQPTDVIRAMKDATIHFRVVDGRVHHDGLKIGFPDISPDLQVTSRGSVGLDKTLDLHLEIPRLDKNQQRAKGPVQCHVTGTISNPKVSLKDASLVVHLPGWKDPFVVIDGLDLKMQVEREKAGPVLVVEPFKVYDRRKLSPETIDQLLQLIDPALRDLPQISGEVSLSVTKVRIPLSLSRDQVVANTEVEGTLTLHKVSTTIPHPLRHLLSKLLADLHGKDLPGVVRIVKDDMVRFRVVGGRIHHDGLKIGFPEISPDLQVISRGSVGLDETLDLYFEIPHLDPDKRKEKGPVQCHVTGTISKPKVSVKGASLVLRVPERKKPLLAVDGIDMTMHVEESKTGHVLVVDPVQLLVKQKFQPDLVGDLVHLLVPGIRDVPDVSGEISLALDKLSIPLGGPEEEWVKKVTMEGKLHLHRISADAKGPVRQLLVKVLADMYGKKPTDVVRVVKDDVVQFRVVDGRLHLDGLKVGFPDISPDLQATMRGSVGLDETLDLHLEVPRLDKNKQKEKGHVQCHVTGTISKPKVSVKDASLVVRLDDRPAPLLDVDGINFTFEVEESKDGLLLSVAPVTVCTKQKLTPELAGELMNLILPTLGDVAKVRGEFSLSLENCRMPVARFGPDFLKKTDFAGKVQLHEVIVTVETPILQSMVKVLADMHGKKPSDVVRVTKNTEIQFRVRDGRLYHEGLKIGFPDISPDLLVTSRGSVGLDRSLDLDLEVPRILANGKIDPDAEKLGPVRFHVTGTFDKPVVTETKNPPKK